MEESYKQRLQVLQDQIQRFQETQLEKVVTTDSAVQSNQGHVAVAEKSSGQLQRAEAWVSELTNQVSRLTLEQEQHHASSSNLSPGSSVDARLTELQAKVARARLQLDQACAWKAELQRLGGVSEGKRHPYSDNEEMKKLRERLELQRRQIQGLEEQCASREALMSDHAVLTELVRISTLHSISHTLLHTLTCFSCMVIHADDLRSFDGSIMLLYSVVHLAFFLY